MDTNNTLYTVGLGEILWDILDNGKKLGGAPANFAYHAKNLGLNSCVVSAVGNDESGDEIIRQLAEKQLPAHLERTAAPTGSVTVALDADGVPRYDIRSNVAWDEIPFNEAVGRIARNCRAVCFGSLAQRSEKTRLTIRRFLESMPTTDGPVYKIHDINLRQNFFSARIIDESLRICNILKINEDEAEIIRQLFDLPTQRPEELCRTLLGTYGLQTVILTCGSAGSHVVTSAMHSYIPTPRITVADTIGAGDSFTAAFLAGLLHGLPLREVHRLAVDVSAYVCTQYGAMPALPDELVRRLGH